jgi:hypothetical protein
LQESQHLRGVVGVHQVAHRLLLLHLLFHGSLHLRHRGAIVFFAEGAALQQRLDLLDAVAPPPALLLELLHDPLDNHRLVGIVICHPDVGPHSAGVFALHVASVAVCD